MQRGTELSEQERAQILDLWKENFSCNKISNLIKKGMNVLKTFVANPITYVTAKRSDQKPNLTPQDERSLIQELKRGGRRSENPSRSSNFLSVKIILRWLFLLSIFCKRRRPKKGPWIKDSHLKALERELGLENGWFQRRALFQRNLLLWEKVRSGRTRS